MRALLQSGAAMRLVSLVCLSAFLTSCIIGYADFPEGTANGLSGDKPYEKLYYQVQDDPIFVTRSKNTLRRILREESPFKDTEEVDQMPSKGVYCLVEVKWKAFGASALFGYLSYAFLFLIPVYSGQEGYEVTYRVFADGKEKESFRYRITRKMGMWAGLLPFVWINLLTTDEPEAFEAVSYQFLQDAQPTFRKL